MWQVVRTSTAAGWLAAALVPLALLVLLRLRPHLDARWENHPAHFWLVLSAAAIATGLGHAVSAAARSRRDARLFLISLAFIAAAGFLGLHALATPGVLLGPNAGFELAPPVGLLIGGAFVAVSALELAPRSAAAVIQHSRRLLGALLGMIVLWAVLSLREMPPLGSPLQSEELNGWQVTLGGLGVLLYSAGSLGYFRLYRRRGARFVFAATLAFALLAESMVVIAFADNWRISWWEWHTLMLAAFTVIAWTARQEWHEERFSPLYLDRTLAGTRDASILFADLEGYTTFTERVGPEAATEMLNSYFARLVPLMEDLDGQVHQIIGDAIMVIFNQDGTQPDHSLLAARAALRFQTEAAAVAAEHPEWPRFRVGINSGEVLAGVVGGERGHRKHDLVGDTVNLAARLEGEAAAGEVVIGRGTYEQLPAGTVVEMLPRLVVKGKASPVDAYILRALPEQTG